MDSINLDFQFTKEDYVQAVHRYLRLSKTITPLNQAFLIFAALADLIYILLYGFTWENIILTVLLVCSGTILVSLWRQADHFYRKNPKLGQRQRYQLTPKGVALQNESNSAEADWDQFIGYWDDAQGVYLLQEKRRYVMLPDKFFVDPQQREQLRQWALAGNPQLKYKDFRPKEGK